ncbi:AfsR/SARP family transcriptional regulator [Geodermatophilus sp. URMC 62]|uniref:AfsR/SARP family transcriptional regulator n=1 Tax=Geodermatophilus sp. URMC 62 TaxID=3423414 RepID=UPI00406D1E85
MLTVAVLGRVEVRRDGMPAPVPGGLTTELLVRLALDAGRPVRAERLVEELWPGTTGTRLNTLQAKVSQLRRALGDPAALTGASEGYTLAVDPGRVDAVRALRLADEGAALLAAGNPAASAAVCREGLVLFGAEVLPAAGGAGWALPHRVRLEETRLRLLEDELAARLALGATGEIVGELESLVAVQPLRERLWALLITALYGDGRQADALAASRRVARILTDELGVDPGPELTALERRVLAHDPALMPDVASAPTGRRHGNIPVPATPLAGRVDDLAALLLALEDHRLVTVVGPAGVGKTRLAVEAAGQTSAPDGAWLVRLEGVRTAGELPVAIADAVPGVDGSRGDVATDLRGADVLLLLDNCEHLAEGVASLVAAVLASAPQVRVLATSQRSLGLDGEQVCPLDPLPEADAVALFAQRAGERRASFVLTGDTAPAVAQLCRALDCLPLAIELAAARTRIMTVPEIARRLDDRFTLLADPTSTRPERRRTLAAALSWSYDLLFPDDQRGLWALAQFPGGATLPALEHVLSGLGVPPGTAIDVVDRLVDRSLVTADADAAGATRYRLLDSVRAFAADRAAEAGASGAAADALVAWTAQLARTVAGTVRGADQAAQVAATAAERATIDAALDRARVTEPVTGLRIAVDLGWAWVLLDDGAAAGRLRAARLAVDEPPRDLEVTALLLESWQEAMSGDLTAARILLDRAAALAEGDASLAVLARWYGGFILPQEGRAGEALADLARCRDAYAGTGATWEEGGSCLLAAFALLALGDTAGGRAACEEAIAILRPLGDAWALLHAEGALGRIAHAEERFTDAARHHGDAAESADRLGFGGAAALHRVQLGRAQHEGGDPAAPDTLQRAVSGAQLAGDRRLLALAQVAQAEVLRCAGNRSAARNLLEAAHRWYSKSGAGEGAALAACLRATMCAEDGEPGAREELQAIRDAAETAGDREVHALATAALGDQADF